MSSVTCRRFLGLAALCTLLGAGPSQAAPARPWVMGVLGTAADGGLLAAAALGARLAAERYAPDDQPIEILAADDEGTDAGLRTALSTLRSAKAVAIVSVASNDMIDEHWKASSRTRVPWFFVRSVYPDMVRNQGNVWLLGPTPAAQGMRGADALVAPLAVRRTAIVHAPGPYGAEMASAFARNLSGRITLAGMDVCTPDRAAESIRAVDGFEIDRAIVALDGAALDAFVAAYAAAEPRWSCLFADGARRADLLAEGGASLAEAAFVDGPDVELQGRAGEDVITALEEAGVGIDPYAVRAYEAVRRVIQAAVTTESTKFRKLRPALEAGNDTRGVFGPIEFLDHRGIRFFPFTLWGVHKGRYRSWPLVPMEGCGPPMAFGRPAPAALNPRGKLGYLTYGEGEQRTIEGDLLEIGLSTDGEDPELDAFLRAEILGRAIRIAHRLFRREADGTPIPGWSWGMTFTTSPPPEDMSRGDIWLATVAGDHPDAGGQVVGSGMVAIYSTFLKRTMYAARKLDPPVSTADRPLLDGSYPWGTDRTRNFRAEKIRCLLDGFASAVGLTLAHEFGHLCGCGHDTEHPTSIMNVVAGAGATWESAVWIPSHQRNLTTTLGIEEVEK